MPLCRFRADAGKLKEKIERKEKVRKEEKNMKKESHAPQIFYIVLLSMQVPFNLIYMWTALVKLEIKTAVIMYVAIAALFFTVVGILGIVNVVKGFRAYRSDDQEYCLRAMLKLKYGMVPFFILNFLGMSTLTFLAVVASRGMVLLMFPLPIIFVAMGVIATWFAMLPGSIYAVWVACFAVKEEKITRAQLVVHIILQLLFLTDVLDAAYLAVRHFHRGKKGAIVVITLYLLTVALCVTGLFLMFHA